MIVVDASAVVEWLLQTALGARVERRVSRDDDELHAPHLIDVEVAGALRRLVRLREISAARADAAVDDLTLLPIIRHGHDDLVSRAWQLCESLTIYDAVYIALAEALDAPFVTCDAAFATAPAHTALVEVIRA